MEQFVPLRLVHRGPHRHAARVADCAQRARENKGAACFAVQTPDPAQSSSTLHSVCWIGDEPGNNETTTRELLLRLASGFAFCLLSVGSGICLHEHTMFNVFIVNPGTQRANPAIIEM